MDVEAATYWLGWVRLIQLIAVFLVAVGVVAEFAGEWISRPLEKFIDQARELQLAQLTKDAARLTTEGDLARKETAQAALQLEELRKQVAARHIKREQFVKILEGKPRLPVEIVFPRDDGEAFQLALEIRNALRAASWEVSDPFPFVAIDDPRLSKQPAMAMGGQPTGVTIAAYSLSPEEIQPPYIKEPPRPITPFTALFDALRDSLGTMYATAGHLNRPRLRTH
jgi:hypothetical protein